MTDQDLDLLLSKMGSVINAFTYNRLKNVLIELKNRGGGGSGGREVELQKTVTHVQWRYVGDATWINLIPLSEITGPQGTQGIQGTPGTAGSNATATTNAADLTSGTLDNNRISNLSADKIIDGTTNKAYTATEKTKMSGIAASATANIPDATSATLMDTKDSAAILAERSAVATLTNKIISQSQITNLVSDLSGKAASSHTHTASNITDFQTQVSANTDVAAMKAIIGTGISDGDTLVDTLAEMLGVFTTYSEGVDIATAISAKANTASLSAVATSGSYADLSNKPTIPTVDSVPTDGSSNAVSSNGVFDAIAAVSGGSTSLHQTATLMKAVRPTNGTVAITGGYATVGDGGTGLYRFDSASVASDDGGSVLLPSTGSGAGRWILVPQNGIVYAKQFGAKFDATTDDTTALQNFFNYGVPNCYRMLMPRGVAKTTSILRIGSTSTAYDPFNSGGFTIEGMGPAVDPSATDSAVSGTQIRFYGTGGTAVLSIEKSVSRFAHFKDFTVACNTSGGATYGFLWATSFFSQHSAERVHSYYATKAFGLLTASAANGEFITMTKCAGYGTTGWWYMDTGSFQSMGHLFLNCSGNIGDGGAVFEVGGGSLGCGFSAVEFNSTAIGSGATVAASFGSWTGTTFFKSVGVEGNFNFFGGRIEHISTITNFTNGSYAIDGKVNFNGTQFVGMICTASRPTFKSTSFGGSYAVSFIGGKMEGMGSQTTLLSSDFDSADAAVFSFSRQKFNFTRHSIRPSKLGGFIFENCEKQNSDKYGDTPLRFTFSTGGALARTIDFGTPSNALLQTGFTVGNTTAPSPWVHTGQTTFNDVKGLGHVDVIGWSDSPNARQLFFKGASGIYQDIPSISFAGGNVTAYYKATLGFHSYGGKLFRIALQNATSGKIYDEVYLTSNEPPQTMYNVRLIANDDTVTGILRVVIENLDASDGTIDIVTQLVSQRADAVFTPTTSTVIELLGTYTNADLSVSNLTSNIITKSGAYTLLSSDSTVLCNTTSAFTLTLPAAALNSGKIYNIKKITTDSNAVTIDANASELIDGDLTQTIVTPYSSLTIQSNGTSWYIL